MKTTLKIISIIALVIGGLAILDGIGKPDGYVIIGGLLFAGQGILALIYIGQRK